MEKRALAFTLMASVLTLLFSCGGTEASSADESETPSSTDVARPSDSEDAPSESSPDTVPSSESQSSDEGESGSFELLPSFIPDLGQSQYHEDATLDLGGYSFYLDDIQQGSGKFEDVSSYIQMKKESGLLRNVSALGGKVTITQYLNVVTYSGQSHDYTASIALKGAKEYGGEYIEMTPSVESFDSTQVLTYENPDGYTHFSLENASSYAAYLSSIAFLW